MHFVGHIYRGSASRNIRGRFQEKLLPLRQHADQLISGRPDTSHRLAIDRYLGEDFLMPIPAAGVRISFVDKLLDRMFTVPNDTCRNSFGDGDQTIVYDEAAKVRSFELLFDNDPSRILLSSIPRLFCILNGVDTDTSSFAVVAVKRFDNGGKPYGRKGIFQLVNIANSIPFRHRNAHRPE